MTRGILRLFFALTLGLALKPSAAQVPSLTASFWKPLSQHEKLVYAQGFMHGCDTTKQLWSGAQSTAKEKLPKGVVANLQRLTDYSSLSTKELVDGIDAFYTDTRNVQMPLESVALIVNYRRQGSSPAMIQAFINRLRVQSSSPGSR